jgi:DNA-binding NtrC family response regulator
VPYSLGMPPRPTGAKVLLVEDDPVLARIYSCALAAAGYVVDHAADGAQGFERLLAGSYDVIVTDLCMPRLSGFDLLEEVRRRRPEVPVVMVTGEIDLKTSETAHEMGTVRFLLKPMTMQQLARAVENSLMLSAARSRSGTSKQAAG